MPLYMIQRDDDGRYFHVSQRGVVSWIENPSCATQFHEHQYDMAVRTASSFRAHLERADFTVPDPLLNKG